MGQVMTRLAITVGGVENRRENRHAVHMLAHFHYRATRSTVVLKDLTCGGARIEGIDGLAEDEAVSLVLPGRRPMLAFVAWSGTRAAGLEFAEPLEEVALAALTARHAIGHGPAAAFPQ